MDISLSFIDIQKAVTKFQRGVGGDCQFENRETILFFPASLGQGYLRSLKLREGLELLIYEHQLIHHLNLDFQALSPQYSFIKLSFCVSGRCSGQIKGLNSSVSRGSGQAVLAHIPHAAGIVELTAGYKTCVIEILIAPMLLSTLTEHQFNAFPTDWQEILGNATSAPYAQLSQTTPEIANILQQILCCPYQGFIRQLYLESKALELIALYFAQLTDPDPAPSSPFHFKQADIDCIYQAKDILLRNLDNPPSLARLAQQVGLNERKLQQGFHQIFSTTVFGVLHNHRMERARQLLEEDQMTIAAIAQTVGIVHRGYFATAFKRKFGSTPREYLKQLGK